MKSRASFDPTRCELLSFLNQPQYQEFSEFDKEAAAYWFASDWHSGQSSSLYAALCESLYRPGPLENSPTADSEEFSTYYLYTELEAEFAIVIQETAK